MPVSKLAKMRIQERYHSLSVVILSRGVMANSLPEVLTLSLNNTQMDRLIRCLEALASKFSKSKDGQ